MLNWFLPPDIRFLGYAWVPEYFDARFSCIYWEYKYFFDPAGLWVDLMTQAANKLIGTHDFWNFCKKDEAAKNEDDDEQNFIRWIYSIKFE